MNVIVAFLLGAVALRVLWLLARPFFATPVLARANYRGVTVPIAGGVLLILVALIAAAAQSTFNAFSWLIGTVGAEALVAFTVTGYGLLGLIDDLIGTADTTGFKGHVAALFRGRLTTGMVKILGGGTLALILVGERSSGGQFLADAALIALAANFANLLDRRPGRVLKVALVAYLPLAVVAGTGPLGVAVAPVMGAALAVFPEDLRERVMLGDTGANLLGGLLGLLTVYVCSAPVRLGVLVALVLLNLASEFVSYTRVINAVAPLRFIDELGRRADNPA